MNLKSFLIFFIILFFIYFRPVYSIIVLVCFSSEYIYFSNYFFKYVNAIGANGYKIFSVSEVDTNNLTSYEIWDKINEIRAFKKVYVLIAKNNRISFKSVLITFLVILGDIPLKVLKISKNILENKGGLRDSLIEMYYSSYWDVKDLKIEIIDKKVYINCSTRGDILAKIIKINPRASDSEICKIYKEIVNLNSGYMREITKYKDLTKSSKFVLGLLETEEGVNIKRAHYSKEVDVDFSYKGRNHMKVLLHGTSNIPNLLTNSQFSTIAMKNLIKENSSKSGTVLTCGNYEFKQTINSSIYVPNWQVYRVMYEVCLKPNINYGELFIEWDTKFSEILKANPNDNSHRQIVQSFGNRYNDFILASDIDTSENEIIKSINEIR